MAEERNEHWLAVLKGPEVDHSRVFGSEDEATEWCDDYLAGESTNIVRETEASVQRVNLVCGTDERRSPHNEYCCEPDVDPDPGIVDPPPDTETHGHRTGEGCVACAICGKCIDPDEIGDTDVCVDCAGDLVQAAAEAHAESLGDMMRDEDGRLT